MLSADGLHIAAEIEYEKYDNAGNLLYARTLGAANEASGLAMTVAADGQVRVDGVVCGHIHSAEVRQIAPDRELIASIRIEEPVLGKLLGERAASGRFFILNGLKILFV